MPDSPETAPALLPQHARLIETSAISDGVARARGYRSARSKAELGRLGFGETQQRVPSLLIPIFDVGGEIAFHQLRPDAPRVVKNRSVKYETPFGVRMVLDVHPFARAHIGDPKVPLFITEGVRKGDAAVSKCLCCVALLGVWNWRGTNEHGGRVALPDWESIALSGREVYIVFDSDVMLKADVAEALARLKAFLESRKASVRLVYLPPKQGGSKLGLDDYLAEGHDVSDLLGLSTEELRAGTPDDRPPTGPYVVHGGRICFEKQTRDGVVIEPLCNFDARVREERKVDDGELETCEFVIGGALDTGRSLHDVVVSAERFNAMNWVTGAWGVDAIPAAGAGRRDQLREAILRLSEGVKRRRIFAHTGWREIDGEMLYLSATGAPGRTGLEVQLGSELSGYALPVDPTDVRSAVQDSLRLLDIAPLDVTATLWSGVYRAPLIVVLPIDLSIWLEGISGSLKSSIVALFLSHWGLFDRKDLPAEWISTVNFLEKAAYILKDAVFVIDDYAPQHLDRRDLELKASRLLRSQGNLSGRGRLQSDLTTRRTFRPRGLIVATGEERPPGQSVLARTFVVELEKEQVDLGRLTACQARAQRLSHAMAGYVAWLAPEIKTLGPELHKSFGRARETARTVGTHLRHPEAIAHLWIGLDLGLTFATAVGAVDSDEAADLRRRCWEAMVHRAEHLGSLVAAERPVVKYVEILASLITQRRARLVERSAADQATIDDRVLGWFDEEFVYLLPTAAFQAVSRFARDSGEPLAVGQTRIRQDLVKEKVADHAEDRTTTPVRIGGKVRRLQRLLRSALSELIGEEFPVRGRPDIDVTDVTDVTGNSEGGA